MAIKAIHVAGFVALLSLSVDPMPDYPTDVRAECPSELWYLEQSWECGTDQECHDEAVDKMANLLGLDVSLALTCAAEQE